MEQDEAPNLHEAVHPQPGDHFTAGSTQTFLAAVLICLALALILSLIFLALRWSRNRDFFPSCSHVVWVVHKLTAALPVVCNGAGAVASKGGNPGEDVETGCKGSGGGVMSKEVEGDGGEGRGEDCAPQEGDCSSMLLDWAEPLSGAGAGEECHKLVGPVTVV